MCGVALSLRKFSYEFEYEFLDSESILGSKSVAVSCAVSVSYALKGDVSLVVSVCAVLIRI